MLNYGLSTKLYIASLSGTSPKTENPILTGQVWPILDNFEMDSSLKFFVFGFHQKF
jgi:hypothetical protein